ncbi:Repetitive proline-rich cell wall protein 2 [Spatholobus suberectus]|nr:Repetitive proline-rich cell wall protein 2 [Spatholobus suberectus]
MTCVYSVVLLLFGVVVLTTPVLANFKPSFFEPVIPVPDRVKPSFVRTPVYEPPPPENPTHYKPSRGNHSGGDDVIVYRPPPPPENPTHYKPSQGNHGGGDDSGNNDTIVYWPPPPEKPTHYIPSHGDGGSDDDGGDDGGDDDGIIVYRSLPPPPENPTHYKPSQGNHGGGDDSSGNDDTIVYGPPPPKIPNHYKPSHGNNGGDDDGIIEAGKIWFKHCVKKMQKLELMASGET